MRGRTTKDEYDGLLMATAKAIETAQIGLQMLKEHAGEHGSNGRNLDYL
jgi:hypothetical protein